MLHDCQMTAVIVGVNTDQLQLAIAPVLEGELDKHRQMVLMFT